MKVLVTGATGFLGSRLCHRLVAEGHDVRAFVRISSSRLALEGLPLEFVVGDIFDPASVRAAVQGTEIVFHCAGQVSRWRDGHQMIDSHVRGTRNVLGACRQSGVGRLVYTSSVAALGVPDHDGGRLSPANRLMTESHEWNTTPQIWPYGFAKHMAEMEVRMAIQAGLDAVILNPSAVFGAGDVHRYRLGIVGRMMAHPIPPVAPAGGLNAVHIEDVVDGHVAAMATAPAGSRHILGGENLTHAQLLTYVAAAVGRPAPRLQLPAWPFIAIGKAAMGVGRILPGPQWLSLLALAGRYFYYDTQPARTALNLAPARSVKTAIHEAADWYRQQSARLA